LTSFTAELTVIFIGFVIYAVQCINIDFGEIYTKNTIEDYFVKNTKNFHFYNTASFFD